ncbi:unnamed protein product [Penicillium salamii]|uniref:Uncharacterized protein n=1 Tax=Penicillium salamii TaxID=1612424 RepID=A0A9W4N6K7_9EURO|nr:unnamed protein product [Penicillium salamii]CAG8093795.1 unnamed protein product [Penicillium salamii]CAG8252580.1 unnamed protein product [Penicillium salamii]CAG8253343.1 unnamed protein product [Penicillium salamii]CAG8305019.1 unnamed protein product [Penicillium salamii]
MDPTQSHGQGTQKNPSPSNIRSPLSPGSGSSGTPISFQPNVNRSKTKRWVEARQYSYDGGDWGDDDDEEEEEDEEAPPPVPRAPYATQHNGSSSELSSRRLSGLGFGADDSASAAKKNVGEQKALPFVRPADLYKRMREDKAAQSPATDGASTPDATGAPPQTDQQAPSVGLPEVKRMSSFGTDFLGGADAGQPENANTAQPDLQHNPSSGYRSVVHQAFDVPETPQSSTTSVERSNSDGTSVISPIIGSRAIDDERTPTILEEPNESSPPRGTATQGPVFHPGHRRDLSLPSSDNSPSKRPQVTDQETPTGDHAEISVISPPQHDIPHPSLENHPIMQPYPNDGQDRPAPLKFGSASGPDSFHGTIPTIMGAEESPQNTDNDRLREEIIQSLSREATPSEEPEQRNQAQSQTAESIPQQFEKYWSPTETPKAQVSNNQPELMNPPPLASYHPYANSQGNSSSTIVDQQKKPKLERRFSWESSDGEEPEPKIPGSYASPPHDTSLAVQEPEPIVEDTLAIQPDVSRDLAASDNESSDNQRAERPRLSLILPVPENVSPPEQVAGPGTTLPQQTQVPSITKNPALDESQLLGFRDIIGITSINQRIKSFEHTRDQFATLDTGLSQWLQFMVNEHSEHTDVVQKSQTLSPAVAASSPSRSRFPKLPSLANLASSNDGTPNSGSHMRRPSAHLGSVMNRQNVGDKGKEFLHTAGTFSGKASGAAKGLFAKGRSKFRPSGGSDKVQSTPSASRRSLQLSFPSDGKSARNSMTFGSLPIFRSGKAGDSAPDSDPSNPSLDSSQEVNREHARVAKSGDKFRSHNSIEAAVQPKHLSASNAKTRDSDKSAAAGDFEQEMIAALGLLPEPRPHRSASTPMSLQPSQINGENKRPTGQPQVQSKTTGMRAVSDMPSKRGPVEKGLPVIPTEPFNVPLKMEGQVIPDQGKNTQNITFPSIRPVFDEDVKPPSPPPKVPDDGHMSNGHAIPRQPSVSTLGPDEETGRRSSEDDFERDPPSPLQPPQTEIEPTAPKQNVEGPVNGNPVSIPKVEPSVDEPSRPFAPSNPSEQATSAEILEFKRKSISGLPPSVPGVQSPLRNEVRYSPGTRSSMLSFGSFGRHSINSKGTRPTTPANGLQSSESSSPAGNGESTLGKIVGFGRRRRASVGDLLSSFQLQGTQASQGGQRKRALSRISGLFGRQESQKPEAKPSQHARTVSEPLQVKDRPLAPSTNGDLDMASPVKDQPPILKNPFEQKPLPNQPDESTEPPAPQSDANPHDTHQQASISLPPNSSTNPLLTGRFYSQLQAGTVSETPVGSRQTRSLSHPLPGQSRSPSPSSVHENRPVQPLSPLEEIQDHQIQQLEEDEERRQPQPAETVDPALGTLSENQEQEEQEEHKYRALEERHELHGEPSPSPFPSEQFGAPTRSELGPEHNVRSRKPTESGSFTPVFENRAVSNISVLSSHPHRSESETRVVNDNHEPVELAITADDSSEEIVMSPTSYPGQEWTPMHL